MKKMVDFFQNLPKSLVLEETANPKDSPIVLIKGPTVKAAKKPYTTVGIPAKISIIGFPNFLTLGVAYSAK